MVREQASAAVCFNWEMHSDNIPFAKPIKSLSEQDQKMLSLHGFWNKPNTENKALRFSRIAKSGGPVLCLFSKADGVRLSLAAPPYATKKDQLF